MTHWIDVNSPQNIAKEERDCLNAYMFWTDRDCYSMTPQQARDSFDRCKWWTCQKTWIHNMIMTQDKEGINRMRTEYTKITKKDWKTATLMDVYEKLGWCRTLYNKGEVLIKGDTRSTAAKEGVTTPQEKPPISNGLPQSASSETITSTLRKVANEDSVKGAMIRILLREWNAIKKEEANK